MLITINGENDSAEVVIKVAAESKRGCSKTGMGIVGLDRRGKLIAVWAMPEARGGTKELITAEATKFALIQAAERKWSKISVMVGNANVTKLLRSKNGNDAVIGTILQNIFLMQRNFMICKFKEIRKDELSIAIKLARFAIALVHDICWT